MIALRFCPYLISPLFLRLLHHLKIHLKLDTSIWVDEKHRANTAACVSTILVVLQRIAATGVNFAELRLSRLLHFGEGCSKMLTSFLLDQIGVAFSELTGGEG